MYMEFFTVIRENLFHSAQSDKFSIVYLVNAVNIWNTLEVDRNIKISNPKILQTKLA